MTGVDLDSVRGFADTRADGEKVWPANPSHWQTGRKSPAAWRKDWKTRRWPPRTTLSDLDLLTVMDAFYKTLREPSPVNRKAYKDFAQLWERSAMHAERESANREGGIGRPAN